MRIKVLTIFPDMVRAALGESIVGRALEKGLLVLTAKDKVRLLPALNIPDALLAEGLDILQSILDE